MSRGYTARAAANIAFLKYWGAVDLERTIPANASLSMTLAECATTTWVGPSLEAREGRDEVLVHDGDGFRPAAGSFRARIVAHLDRLRTRSGADRPLRVLTRNAFPAAAGMASSASGFCALSAAAAAALGQPAEGASLSELARRSGSGSAARSAFGGFVRWPGAGVDLAALSDAADPTCPAEPVAPAEHWDLADVIAVVDDGPKGVSSLEGHRRTGSSPHFPARLAAMPERMDAAVKAILARDLDALGPLIELDAIELHAIAMTSSPPVHYWRPGTIAALDGVRALRAAGLPAWATMDAGPNVHVIVPCARAPEAAAALAGVDGVRHVIEDRIGGAPTVREGAPEGWPA